jgi:amidase
VGDLQIPIALTTQTGGSTIRPASFNGIYALKPTWGAISREGQKQYSAILDTLGMFARSVDDLDTLAEVFDLVDDEESPFAGIKGARFAMCRTMVWPEAGSGTRSALARGVELLRAHGAVVDEIDLPSSFDKLPEWHQVVLQCEGRATFLPGYRVAKEKLAGLLVGHVENNNGFTRKQQLEAFDGVGALRPQIDEIAGRYAAILTPSVPDEAPKGLGWTGNPNFCSIWNVSIPLGLCRGIYGV